MVGRRGGGWLVVVVVVAVVVVLGVGVISHQLVRIHINTDRRWFRENTHQREIYTSELAKPHVDAGFKKHAADRPKCRISCGR